MVCLQRAWRLSTPSPIPALCFPSIWLFWSHYSKFWNLRRGFWKLSNLQLVSKKYV